jgi:hypothetical protein
MNEISSKNEEVSVGTESSESFNLTELLGGMDGEDSDIDSEGFDFDDLI